MAFAQGEVVDAFLQGVDPALQQALFGATGEVFNRALAAILDAVKRVDPKLHKGLSKTVNPQLGPLLEGLRREWSEKCQEHVNPVLQIASTLPKDELAAMAEALVNLTKFRRRITTVPETVGGPIDVAVITKGDGFVWIRRKHYFDPALNQRVVARYHKEGT
jgi:hypothetical protein